ncbi:MAG: DUF3987 domain-containing protein [Gemmataceae bacterium]
MGSTQSKRGKFTLADVASAKKLPLDWLQNYCDLRDLGNGVIGIPYWDDTGNELFVRQRNPPGTEPRFRQPKGIKLVPYGLNRLDIARRDGRLFLCEGESDTWSLWRCAFPALGIPGAGAAKSLQTDHVEGIADVYLLPDNDSAGEQFVEGIVRHLGELCYTGRIWRLQVPRNYKDVSEWYVAAGSKGKFLEELETAVAAAKLLRVEAARPSRNGDASAGRPQDRPPPEPEPWPPPVPLNETPTPPEFPLGVLPEPLRRFASEAAASIPCPLDYVAVPMLVFAGAAIGASRALEIKHGRTERPCLYAAVVGSPSCGKTPCRTFAARPLHEEQARLYEIFRRERQAHEDGVDDAPKPKERTLYVSDVTTEKLANVLQENPRGVAVDRDELTAWVRSMDQYRSGKGADRQFWLSAWSGDPISVHRKNQDAGPVRVAHPFVSVVGGLPPDLLTAMRGERGVADGFMDRILFSYPQEPAAAGETWSCIPDDCEKQWRICLMRLFALEMVDDPQHGPRPHFVRLTSCGRQAWKKLTDDLAAVRNSDSTPDCIKSSLGKMNSYGARLALIVHYLRLATDEVDGEDVDGESMDRAAQLITYFQGHLFRVHSAMAAATQVAETRRVLNWIVSNRLQRFQKRDAYQANKGTFKTVDELEAALTLLQKHGYIHPVPPIDRSGPGRKPSPEYEVNPDALTT